MSASRSTRFVLVLCLFVGCSSEVSVGARDGGPSTDSGAPDAASAADGGALDANDVVDAARTCTDSAQCGAQGYCHKPYGMCAGTGVCETFDPTVACDVTPDLVCGCDGHTYNNACAAHRAGISGDHLGDCPFFADGCISDLDCMLGYFCELPTGSCGGTGTCTNRGIGAVCATICAPECACDGTSYENACMRRKAAASLMQTGTCPGTPPPCTMGGGCCTSSAECMVAQECASTGGPMKCMPIPASPDCWLDLDCGAGHTCMDPYICPCGSSCPRPDTPGTCV